MTLMASSSLTKQAGFLMAGKFLSMPLAFLVPVFLTRKFSLEEFGYYKQLFLIFNVLLPIIDFGITNSLYYFLPRYNEDKSVFIGQTLLLTSLLCLFALAAVTFVPGHISVLFTNEYQIQRYVFLLGLFAVSWHLSNLLEVVLIVEKRALGAGVVSFLSETARAVVSIGVVLFGYGLKELLIALVCVGICRCLLTAYYLFSRYNVDFGINFGSIKRQLLYSIPFGAAVIVNGFVGNVHQYVVSVTSDTANFAIFAVGCFQLPFLMVAVDSIAKTSLVRMAELRNHENAFEKIAVVVSSSCRKLWLLFFPVFVFLFVVADEFIEILFTDQYLASVPTFRIFIFIIPLSAILIQHVPRALDQTNFILFNNIFVLILSVSLCWVGGVLFGIEGVAVGFVVAHFVWKLSFLLKCSNILGVEIEFLLPYKEMIRSGSIILLGGGCAYFIKELIDENLIFSFVASGFCFILFCCFAYRYFRVLNNDEIQEIVCFLIRCKKRIVEVLSHR